MKQRLQNEQLISVLWDKFSSDIKFELLKSSYEETAGVEREVIFVLIKLFKFDENNKHMY